MNSEKEKSKSTNIFDDFCTTCLGFIDILDLCSEPDMETQTNIKKQSQSHLEKFKSELFKKGVDFNINENNKLDITTKSDKNHKAVTKYLIKFIANEYKDDKNLVNQLNSLPEIGSDKQDEILIENAYKIAKYKDDQENLFNINPQNPMSEIKKNIKKLYQERNNPNQHEQFSRKIDDFTTDDFTTNIVTILFTPFQLCSGKEDSKNERSH